VWYTSNGISRECTAKLTRIANACLVHCFQAAMPANVHIMIWPAGLKKQAPAARQ